MCRGPINCVLFVLKLHLEVMRLNRIRYTVENHYFYTNLVN